MANVIRRAWKRLRDHPVPPVSIPPMPTPSASPAVEPTRNSASGPPRGVRPSVLGAVSFGLRLHRHLLTKSPDRNLLLSPFTLSLGLATLATAARGKCFDSIIELLDIKADTPAALRDEYAKMMRLLEDIGSEVQLHLGSSLWLDRAFVPDSKWVEDCRNTLDTEVFHIDFGKDTTVALIDQWVRERTAGRIRGLVEGTDPLMIMVFISVIYFLGSWTFPYDPNNTRQLPFHSPSGSRPHPMMVQSGSFSYFENQAVQAISLPYGRHAWMDFCVFMPQRNRSLPEVMADLNPQRWWNWMASWECNREGKITLPRFQFSCDLELTEPLRGLGMAIPFDRQLADFSGALPAGTPAFINRIRQKAFIEVNEKGTEATSAYSFDIERASLQAPPPFQMVVDRPFIFAIRDRRTDLPLFMGSVVDPGRQND